MLTGRIWAGHNILKFDCARIREAFAEIGRPPPEPKGSIDSLALLTQKFGRRAGDMKVLQLALSLSLLSAWKKIILNCLKDAEYNLS